MIAELRYEFPEQVLLIRRRTARAGDLGHVPERVTGERRIVVGGAQEKCGGFVPGPAVLQQAREQVIVVVSRKGEGVDSQHLAQQRFGPGLIVAIDRGAQPRVPLRERLRLGRRAELPKNERRGINDQRDEQPGAGDLYPENFMEEFGHQDSGPHFTLVVLRLMKSIITYSPRRRLVVK